MNCLKNYANSKNGLKNYGCYYCGSMIPNLKSCYGNYSNVSLSYDWNSNGCLIPNCCCLNGYCSNDSNCSMNEMSLLNSTKNCENLSYENSNYESWNFDCCCSNYVTSLRSCSMNYDSMKNGCSNYVTSLNGLSSQSCSNYCARTSYDWMKSSYCCLNENLKNDCSNYEKMILNYWMSCEKNSNESCSNAKMMSGLNLLSLSCCYGLTNYGSNLPNLSSNCETSLSDLTSYGLSLPNCYLMNGCSTSVRTNCETSCYAKNCCVNSNCDCSTGTNLTSCVMKNYDYLSYDWTSCETMSCVSLNSNESCCCAKKSCDSKMSGLNLSLFPRPMSRYIIFLNLHLI